MLTGTVLSTDLDRVYAVFRVLCEMGNVDPDAERWDDKGVERQRNSGWRLGAERTTSRRRGPGRPRAWLPPSGT
jgi:hypothetical protein